MSGLISQYNLDAWWEKELTGEERKTIEGVYGTLANNSSIIIDFDGGAFELVSGLLSWFYKPEYYQVINKIVKLADSMLPDVKNISDIHFYYLHKIKAYYPCREVIPGALDLAIKACEDQINIAKKSLKQFIKEGGRPEHTGYKQLCIIRDKQGNYAEVIRLATQAKAEGWPGDWDKRIEKAKKKLEEGK
jgi:hypothetical protein